MLEINASITNQQKQIKVPSGLRTVLRTCCLAVLQEEKIDDKCEVSIFFVDNEEIKQLNKQFLGKNRVTDVLSFPLGENGVYDRNIETGGLMLGDIVISLEKAFAQAKEYSHSFERETAFLITHSMLHLLGYDHEDDGRRAEIMRQKEEKILSQLNINRW